MPKMLIEIDTDTQVVVPRDELAKISDWLYSSANIQQHSFDEPPEPASQFDHELVCASQDLAMLAAAPQPAPIQTGWQPIETAPEGLHLRAAWVYNVPNHDWMIEVHSGYVDDYGMFVNQYGDTYGIAPNGYFGWQPQPPAPGGEG